MTEIRAPGAPGDMREVRRLFREYSASLCVAPEARGLQLGRRLAERVCREAWEIGYRRIFLDTLATMTAAQALYRSPGFRPTEPYVYNPIAGAEFLALDLAPGATTSPESAWKSIEASSTRPPNKA